MENRALKQSHWEVSAQKDSKIKTSPDQCLDLLEKAFMKKYLKKSQDILDIGSGDGLATFEFAKHVRWVDALEYSPTLLKIAQNRQKRGKIQNITWTEGSAVNLDNIYRGKKFNIFISKRVIMNLSSVDEQTAVIEKIAALCRSDDLFLLSEGFTDTFKNLQRLRKNSGLKEFPIVKFNLYLERQKFESKVKRYFNIIEQNNFGIYYFLSHFYYPLVIKPGEPKSDSKMNKIAAQIALKEKLLEEYGYTNFYALLRK